MLARADGGGGHRHPWARRTSAAPTGSGWRRTSSSRFSRSCRRWPSTRRIPSRSSPTAASRWGCSSGARPTTACSTRCCRCPHRCRASCGCRTGRRAERVPAAGGAARGLPRQALPRLRHARALRLPGAARQRPRGRGGGRGPGPRVRDRAEAAAARRGDPADHDLRGAARTCGATSSQSLGRRRRTR